MQSLKYRNNEYKVKDNTLGIGKVIAELAAKYEDELAISQYVVVRMPDFDRYQLIMNELSVLGADMATQAAELKKAKGKEKTKLEKIVESLNKAIMAAYKQLEEPAIQFIFNRMTNIRKEVRFGFVNDIEIFKTLCQTLLIGDVAGIDYTDTSKDLLKLRDEVFAVFFSIKSRIYS